MAPTDGPTDGPIYVFKQGLAKLFQTEQFSDFTIKCGSQTFNVHKAIICPQSEYFRAPCRSFQESETSCITLKAIGDDEDDEACDDPEAVKLMVDFFYHFDYNVATGEPPSNPAAAETMAIAPVAKTKEKGKMKAKVKVKAEVVTSATFTDLDTVVHAKVFAVAVKYGVPGLRSLAVVKFKAAAELGWDESSFAEAAHIVYTTTAEDVHELRVIVANTIANRKTLLVKPEIESVVRSISGLAYELLVQTQDIVAKVTKCGEHSRVNEWATSECTYCYSACSTACAYCGRNVCTGAYM